MCGKSKVQASDQTNSQGLKVTEENSCLCYKMIFKWLNILVFSDEAEKPQVPFLHLLCTRTQGMLTNPCTSRKGQETQLPVLHMVHYDASFPSKL